MAFCNETFFGQSEIFKRGRIFLARGHIDKVLRGEFWDHISIERGMARRAEIPSVIISAADIKTPQQWQKQRIPIICMEDIDFGDTSPT
jgi:hypothetical protein